MARLSCAFSNKWENHEAMLVLAICNDNYCRVRSSLKMTPAVASRIDRTDNGVAEDDPMSEGRHSSRWMSLAKLTGGVAVYAYAAALALGTIVGAIVDFRRHLPNPMTFPTFRYAFMSVVIASAALAFIAYRLMVRFRRVR